MITTQFTPLHLTIVIVIAIGIYVMYITLLQGTLKEVSRENQVTKPNYAWLLLIPLFTIIWAFIFYPRLSQSLEREFESRGNEKKSDYGKGLGYALAITGVLALMPYIGFIFGIGNLIIWIIYWVTIAKFKAALVNSESGNKGIGASHDLLDN